MGSEAGGSRAIAVPPPRRGARQLPPQKNQGSHLCEGSRDPFPLLAGGAGAGLRTLCLLPGGVRGETPPPPPQSVRAARRFSGGPLRCFKPPGMMLF